MPSSQSDWDAKHRLAARAAPSEPAGIVRELLPLLPTGAALDFACGAGRHALLLAARGQQVTAVDWSSVALETLEARARSAQVPVRKAKSVEEAGSRKHEGIDLVQQDLEQVEIPERRYDLILCVQYLQRPLFPQMARALRPGGVMLFETFTRAQLQFSGGPRNPDYLIETGELSRGFSGASLAVLPGTARRAGNCQPAREEAGHG